MERIKTKTAVYPGSFDPITLGHIDIINRSLKIFDKIIVAVSDSRISGGKTPLFSTEERVSNIREALGDNKNIIVEAFQGLLADYLKKNNLRFIIRGMRAISDFEHEFQMSLANKRLYPDTETFFVMTDKEYLYVSSSLVKEIASHNGELDKLVPPNVENALRKKFSNS